MLPTRVRVTPHSLWHDPWRLFRDVFDAPGALERAGTADSGGNGGAESRGLYGQYPIDIHENDDTITLEAELPGFSKDQIEVTIENGVLTISAERTALPTLGAPTG